MQTYWYLCCNSRVGQTSLAWSPSTWLPFTTLIPSEWWLFVKLDGYKYLDPIVLMLRVFVILTSSYCLILWSTFEGATRSLLVRSVSNSASRVCLYAELLCSVPFWGGPWSVLAWEVLSWVCLDVTRTAPHRAWDGAWVDCVKCEMCIPVFTFISLSCVGTEVKRGLFFFKLLLFASSLSLPRRLRLITKKIHTNQLHVKQFPQ